MIYTLTFTEGNNSHGFKKILKHFIPEKPVCTLTSVDNITVKNISYNAINNNVNWDKICKLTDGVRSDIICSDDICFPDNIKLKKFYDRRLVHRLCENAVLSFLGKCRIPPKKLRITLLDIAGNYTELAERLVMYTNSLTVITDAIDFYSAEAVRIVYEKGAPLFVAKKHNSTIASHIIVSPEKIVYPLKTNNSTVIFTGESPTQRISGIVFDSYSFDIPEKYRRLCPEKIKTIDLACALYSKKNVYSMGEIIPNGFIYSGIEYTSDSLYKHIKSIIDY